MKAGRTVCCPNCGYPVPPHHGTRKRTSAEVLAIRAAVEAGVKLRTLAAQYHTSVSNVQKIGSRQTWKWLV